jgi:hypothetical protein
MNLAFVFCCQNVNNSMKLTSVFVLFPDCEYVCRLIQSGTHNALPFLVMELLGENLAELRRKQRGNRFSLSTTARLGKQVCLQRLQTKSELSIRLVVKVCYLDLSLLTEHNRPLGQAGVCFQRRAQCVVYFKCVLSVCFH